MKAMIFAAGLGTRFKPWTNYHPKALAMVNGRSLLEINLKYLQRYDIWDILVNVHHFADQIVDEIRSRGGWGSNISISDEATELLETGGGLKNAAWFFKEGPFLAMNVDILTDLNLFEFIDFHFRHHPLASLAVADRKSSRYFLFDDSDNLCGWKNVKTGEVKGCAQNANLAAKAFSGIHLIDPRIFPLMTGSGKFSIVDTYLELAKSEIIKGFDHSASRIVDVGKPEAIAEAEKLFSH